MVSRMVYILLLLTTTDTIETYLSPFLDLSPSVSLVGKNLSKICLLQGHVVSRMREHVIQLLLYVPGPGTVTSC